MQLLFLKLIASCVLLAAAVECETSRSPHIQCLGNLLVDLLTEIRDSLTCSPALKCRNGFKRVGDTCLFLDKIERHSWRTARGMCQSSGGDLAVFKDANAFAAALQYINSEVQEDEVPYVYVGGQDEEEEGVWKWINGEQMPKGAPFWGSSKIPGFSIQPDGGSTQNCAVLNGHDGYYIHDGECTLSSASLCQIG